MLRLDRRSKWVRSVDPSSGISIRSAAAVGGEIKLDLKREYVGKEKNTIMPSVLQREERNLWFCFKFEIFYSCSEVMVTKWKATFLPVSESVSCNYIWSSPSPTHNLVLKHSVANVECEITVSGKQLTGTAKWEEILKLKDILCITCCWKWMDRHMKPCAQSAVKISLSVQVVNSTVLAAISTLVTVG